MDKYASMRENIIENIDHLLLQMDKDKKNDQAFIDEEDIEDENFMLVKQSLIKCSNELEFIQDLDKKIRQQAKKAEQQLKDKHKVEVTGINDRMASIKQELQSSKEECKALKSSQKELEKQAKKKSQESKQQKSSKSQSASRQKSMTMKQTKSNKKLKAGDNQLEDKTDTL